MSQSQNSNSSPETFYTAGGNKGISRRGFMRIGAASIGAAAVGGAGISMQTERAAAISPVDVVTFGAYDAAEWLIRESGVLGAESPDDGLTESALETLIYDGVNTRHSNNQSTFIDNQNILQGADEVAYEKGKIAAFEEINDGASEADVTQAAETAVEEHYTTIQKNLAKSFNEAVSELYNFRGAVEDHPDLSASNVFTVYFGSVDSGLHPTLHTGTVELVDGTAYDANYVVADDSAKQYATYGPPLDGVEDGDDRTNDNVHVGVTVNGEEQKYLRCEDWKSVFDTIDSNADSIISEIGAWVTGVYDDVQSGEVETEDLITPSMRAEMMSDDEDYPRAYADLIALNLPIDSEREATITIENVNATLRGTLITSDDSVSLEAGTTYDPDDDISGDIFLTYDVAAGSGEWSEYETGIDGGLVTFTSEPLESVEYVIETNNGEEASVTYDDFEETDGGGAWEVDISDQVEESISEVAAVNYYPETTETRYETIKLDSEFTVESFTDSDGEEYDSADFERSSEPHSDDNYITQEEWDELERRNEELIEKYEESQESAGGGGGFLSGIGDTAEKAVIAGVAVLVGYGILTR